MDTQYTILDNGSFFSFLQLEIDIMPIRRTMERAQALGLKRSEPKSQCCHSLSEHFSVCSLSPPSIGFHYGLHPDIPQSLLYSQAEIFKGDRISDPFLSRGSRFRVHMFLLLNEGIIQSVILSPIKSI